MLKSVVLKLLTRLIIKLRYVCSKTETALNDHFEQTNISKDFVSGLLSEIMIQMES